MFDIVTSLNRIVSAGILHTPQLGTVKPDALCNLIDRPAAVFPTQMYIDVNTFTGVDQRGHPTRANHPGITVSLYI